MELDLTGSNRFSEIEIYERSEIVKKRGTGITVTRGVRVNTDEELTPDILKAAGEAARIAPPSESVEPSDNSGTKWKLVPDFILPLIPDLIDLAVKIPDVIEAIQKAGIFSFSKNPSPTCVERQFDVTIDLSVSLEKVLPEIAMVHFEHITTTVWETGGEWELFIIVDEPSLNEHVYGIQVSLDEGTVLIVLNDSQNTILTVRNPVRDYFHTAPNRRLHDSGKRMFRELHILPD